VTIYGIVTKFNTTVPTYTVLLCTKFQNNRITRLLFDKKKKNKIKMTRKKNEETQPIFEGSYLGNTWHDLVDFGM